MKCFLSILTLFLVLSCGKKEVEEQHLSYLNGYWEIQKVEFPNGEIKEYKTNTVIDFIHLENKQGIRKKVQPKLNGTYIVSGDDETFKIWKTDEMYSLHYGSGTNERQERLMQLDSLAFATQNEEGITYFYTRFQPFSIQP